MPWVFSTAIKSDMWWLEFLSIFNGVLHSLLSSLTPGISFADLHFATDASLRGAGAT